MKFIRGVIAFFAILWRNLDPFRIMQEEEMDNKFLILELEQRICVIEKMLYDVRTCPVLNRNMQPEQDFLIETLNAQLQELHLFRDKVRAWK